MSNFNAVAVDVTTVQGVEVFEEVKNLALELALKEGVSVEVVTDYNEASSLADRMWEGAEEWDSSSCWEESRC